MRMLESVTLRQVPGLVGPKPRRIGVGDGHQVNIPEQVTIVNSSQYVTRAVSW